jgi:K(+)-stimulated pyrophosphate-energized sodium pump
MKDSLMYIIPILGVVGLVFMAVKSAWVVKQDAGDEKMQDLAGKIARGAMAFLKAEWRVLTIFALIAGVLLAWSGTIHEVNGVKMHSHWSIAIAFVIGAFFSAFAGWVGMSIATKANVRTAQAARTSLAKALSKYLLQVVPLWALVLQVWPFWVWVHCLSFCYKFSFLPLAWALVLIRLK